MNTVTLLGIDIGKNTFHLHGQDARGHQAVSYTHLTLPTKA